MKALSSLRISPVGGEIQRLLWRWMCGLAALSLILPRAVAQEDQLNKVNVQPPAASAPSTKEPKGAEAPPETGPGALKIRPGSFIRMNVDLVLVPVTVTDPMNRQAVQWSGCASPMIASTRKAAHTAVEQPSRL